MKFSALSSKIEKNKIKLLFGAAVLLFILSITLGVMIGSTNINIGTALRSIFGGNADADGRILLYVRLPRTLGCILTGAALSVSGALIQAVLANKLASPGIIGVNSGAGLAVTLCCALGIYGGWRLSLFAFLGAFTAVMLISLCSIKWGASRGTVILMGVALNSFLNALSDAVISFVPDISAMTSDFRIGDFSSVTYPKLIPATVIVIATLGILFTLAEDLDVLTLGEDVAAGLGMNTKRTRVIFLVFASLLAGSAVSLAGLLSFVGLLIPHSVRRLGVTESKHLLPLCALFGGGFVTLCDLIARCTFSPYEIPVGIIMAFLGAPFFVFILIKRKGGHAA